MGAVHEEKPLLKPRHKKARLEFAKRQVEHHSSSSIHSLKEVILEEVTYLQWKAQGVANMPVNWN